MHLFRTAAVSTSRASTACIIVKVNTKHIATGRLVYRFGNAWLLVEEKHTVC